MITPLHHKYLLISVVLGVLTACTGKESSQFTDIPEKGWPYTENLIFQQPADTTDNSATTLNGSLNLIIRHTNSYLYSNLWMEVKYTDADAITHTDTLALDLCDVYGRWYGKGAGSLYQFEKTVNPRITLMPGSDIIVRHIMRVDTLVGIEKVGVAFRHSES